MSSVWVVVMLGVVAAVVSLVIARLRGDRERDLGAVSHQWVSEHRLGPGHDSRS